MRTIPSHDVQANISTTLEPAAAIATHLGNVRRVLSEVPVYAVHQTVDILRDARDRGAFIYIAGNGGSSSTASHWVNDLGKATKNLHQPPLRVISLNDNVSWLTALANDEG